MTDTNWSDEFLLMAKSQREMRLARSALRMMIDELGVYDLTGHTIVENDIGVRVMAYDSAGEIAINLGFERDGVRPVILLDLELPNGKTLRQSTGAECAKAGGFFAEVAKHIKATEVVDKHLTETDLQNIKRRIYK